jgi:hypothetical protein
MNKIITVYWDTQWSPQNPHWVVSWEYDGLAELRPIFDRWLNQESPDHEIKQVAWDLIRNDLEDPREWDMVVDREKYEGW